MKRFASLLIALMCFPLPVSAQREKLNLGYDTLAPSKAEFWVGKEAGIFERNGLEVEPHFLEGGVTAKEITRGGQAARHRHGEASSRRHAGHDAGLGRLSGSRGNPDVGRLSHPRPWVRSHLDEEYEARGAQAPLLRIRPSEHIRSGRVFFPGEEGADIPYLTGGSVSPGREPSLLADGNERSFWQLGRSPRG